MDGTMFAAHTNAELAWPGYIIVRHQDDKVVLVVRGDPKVRDGVRFEADTVELTLDESDWDQLLAKLAHDRRPTAG